MLDFYILSSAPLGHIYNTPYGGGLSISPSYLRNYWWNDFQIQRVFYSPAKVVEGNLILFTSGSPMTSQVKSNKKYRHLKHAHTLVDGDR